MIEQDATHAIDPVCGMTVDKATARLAGLSIEYNGQTYYFCGKGCLLEFRDDPDTILAPGYRPTM
jgi:YHS domain-containing protein